MKAKHFKILVEIDYTDITKSIQLFRGIKESDLKNPSSFDKKINEENKLKITNYLFNEEMKIQKPLDLKPLWEKTGFNEWKLLTASSVQYLRVNYEKARRIFVV